MCVNYLPVSRRTLFDTFHAPLQMQTDASWPEEAYQDYLAPLIRHDDHGRRVSLVGSYGMVPKQHIPQGVKRYATLNARAETVGELRSYSGAWKRGQLCLLPMEAFYEPNWETGKHIRYRIGMADKSPFAVAGLYRQWQEDDGQASYSFTQLTVNADAHPLMKHMHRIDDEKRSLVIVPADDYDDWLACRDPEAARSFLRLFPAALMEARPEPKEAARKKAVAPESQVTGTLF
jgi:putative SOS response-associated peptidase YedK